MLVLHGNLIRVVDNSIILTSQLFERLALGLRNAECSEDTQEHEESVDLEHVIEPRIGVRLGCATNTERCNGGLCDDGADFA